MATVAATQALLDSGDLKRGIQIQRADVTGSNTSYYCVGITTHPGKARWHTEATASSDAVTAAAITATLAL